MLSSRTMITDLIRLSEDNDIKTIADALTLDDHILIYDFYMAENQGDEPESTMQAIEFIINL